MDGPRLGIRYMRDKVFVDTNILLYVYDRAAGNKREIASELVRQLWHDGTGALSTQVLQEFYVNVTRKIPRPVSPAEARTIISRYLVWHMEVNTGESLVRASEIEERHRLSFWDALIITAAAQSGAATLLSEDLNHGQVIEGVKIVNPFRSEAADQP